ncbi:uncharacterized protein LOC135385086 [Ornithodoros turicata]|uniref:uncharacterized protein LOC135385086 n=1 Tax=Ornithodoros turicata TaxID=34597 RepID=UPI003139C3B8
MQQYGPQLPQTVRMELGVVCDHEHREAFSSKDDHEEYVVLFMRSVTLRFNFHTPKIQFRLVELRLTSKEESNKLLGIEPQSEGATGIIDDAIDGAKVLLNLEEFMKKSVIGNQRNVDVAYMITTRPNIKEYYDDGIYVFVPGMTYKDSVCTDYNVAIGWDDAKFYLGIDVAVRLLANMLGAPWETNDTDCKFDEGFLMGNYMKYSQNSHQFSECSKNGMRQTLR